MSKKGFPFPLPRHALGEFCHPAAGSVFDRPRFHEGYTWTGNTHLALKISKGNWMDGEIESAEDAPEFLKRIRKLDWNAPFDRPEWSLLEEVAPRLFGRKAIGLWLNGKTNASPVVMVGGRFRARLSVLQLVSRLPRVEVYTGPADRSAPLWLRFSGGCGVIARASSLDNTPPAFAIFEPRRDGETGERVERPRNAFQGLESVGNWPPPEPVD